MKENQLLSCPFCGNTATMEQISRNGLRIKCRHCPAEMKQKTLRHNIEWLEDSMIKDWNTRQENNSIF
jgi:ribosomal protein L37AE/L43A